MEPEHTYRADIDGLRAVSIVLVVLFHAGVAALGGGYIGVDVFFVVSGFLITGLLLDEGNRAGRIRLGMFYARRARRLLPMAGLTLTTTAIVGWIVLSPLTRGSLIADIEAAAFYVANFRFISVAGDYFTGGEVAQSFVLHHWSLAIEEQFYLVWPLLLLFVYRFGRGRRFLIVWLLALIGLDSLLASVTRSADLGIGAYYGTHLRIWELAVGAGLAVGRPALSRLPRGPATVAAVAGLGAILASAVLYDATTIYPGSAALVPVLGSAAIIAAGIGGGTHVGRLLGTGPMAALGRLSYGWYLWHWPALMVASTIAGTLAGLPAGIAVGCSLLLAWLSHRVIEQPARTSSWLVALPRRSLALGLTLMIVPVAAGSMLVNFDTDTSVAAPAGSTLAMTPFEARTDWRHPGLGECAQGISETAIATPCRFGARKAGAPTIALIGDSHALQWFPAMRRASYRSGWNLHVWTKGGCQFIDVQLFEYERRRTYTECAEWRAALLEHLRTLPRLDAVVIGRTGPILSKIRTDDGRVPSDEELPSLLAAASTRSLLALRSRAPRVIILRDTPNLVVDPNECIARSDDPHGCAFDPDFLLPDGTLFEAEISAGVPGVRHLDLTPLICDQDPCPVISTGGLIMYRDRHHLTASFVATLAGPVAKALTPLLPR